MKQTAERYQIDIEDTDDGYLVTAFDLTLPEDAQPIFWPVTNSEMIEFTTQDYEDFVGCKYSDRENAKYHWYNMDKWQRKELIEKQFIENLPENAENIEVETFIDEEIPCEND